ncbi:GDSL-type esterase/lipase family protein [Microbacterium dextranolyticum]|uniref:Lipase n=1 Tax=Microbacterium dextranolyticum TaxID=36806 RepID=A0A9W6HJ13_9MICO|nr:SGNH/GDSL hydrolase family protein [Microbacterium dextranolyticum]MBM7461860.1 hypothetical protein [Microbacterium dextranolyticum]GLJ94101.1 lipase [Microbacterium dextranolyticum]
MTTPLIAPATGIGEVVRLGAVDVLLEGHLDIDDTDGIRPLRLPRRAGAHFPPNGEILRAITSNASGVRVRLTTAATRLSLTLRCTQLFFDELPGPVNDIVVEVDGAPVHVVRAPVTDIRRLSWTGDAASSSIMSPPATLEFTLDGAGEKDVTVWLPQGMTVDLQDLSADAPVAAAEPSRAPVWIHHGSSISHCVETPSPTGAWPVIAARRSDLSLVNLGFGGQCMLDPFVADAIAASPADVISLKVGVNIVGARSMDQRTFTPAVHGFLDRVRVGHPDTPIVLASSILWPGSEDVPGPADVEFLEGGRVRCHTTGAAGDVAKGALTMTESRRQLAEVARVRAASGEPISYLDGLSLFGPDDQARYTLPDSLHPDAELYAEIAARFAAAVFGEDGLVPRRELG